MPQFETRRIRIAAGVVLLLAMAAADVQAGEIDYGVIGITSLETARLSAYCSEESPEPCQVELHFHDIRGRIVKQSAATLQPGGAGFLDITAADLGLTARRGEIVPCLRVERGGAFGSVQLFDNYMQRTRVFANSGDRGRPLAGELHFGPIGITPLDTARLNASCSDDATRTGIAEPCEVTFNFHASGGRIFKQATMTLAPGSSGFMDLRSGETGLTFRRGEIVPCLRVARGAIVATHETIDTFTGLTATFAYPAALVSP